MINLRTGAIVLVTIMQAHMPVSGEEGTVMLANLPVSGEEVTFTLLLAMNGHAGLVETLGICKVVIGLIS